MQLRKSEERYEKKNLIMEFESKISKEFQKERNDKLVERELLMNISLGAFPGAQERSMSASRLTKTLTVEQEKYKISTLDILEYTGN